MAKPFKIVNNSDAGTADLYGGNDIDNMATFLNAQSDFHTYTYYVYLDGTTIKAKNGATGEVTYSHASDVGNVLASIFNSVSSTTPLYIKFGAGDFTIKSWGETNFRHSNFTIEGQGSGLTNFIVHNDVNGVAGQNRVFSFEAAGSAYTSNTIQSNAPKGSFAVLTNTVTDLAAGDHVVVGSSLVIAGTATAGEHNRIVKIVATGGSPSQRIILEKSTRYAYNTADSAFIRKVDYLENNHFKGFTIKSNNDLTSQIAFMRLDFNYDCHIEDVQFKDWGPWTGGGFHHCFVNNSVVNSYFNNLSFENSPERGHSTGGSGGNENPNGYAISTRGGCETVYYTNCTFKGPIRHCFTTTANSETAKNGQPINIWLVNCNAETTTESSFDTHEEGSDINFINCSMHSTRSAGATDSVEGTEDTDAFNIRGNNTRCINCSVIGIRGKGFSCDGTTSGNVFDGCYVDGLTLGSSGKGITPTGTNHVVRNCVFKNIHSEAIEIGDNSSNIQVSNCVVKNVCTNDNSLPAVEVGTGCSNIQLNGLIIDTSNDSAIVPIKTGTGCTDITMDNIHLIGAGTDPVFLGDRDKWNPTTCLGRGLNRPPYKIGRVEGNGGSNTCTGLWEGQTSDTNGNKRIETTDGTFREYAIATLNTVAGIKSNNYTERDNNPYIRLVYRLEQTTGLRFFFGWNSDDSAVGPTGADPLANKSGFMVKLDTSVDSNIKIYHNSGDATTTTGATIAAVDTNRHVIELKSYNGEFKWRYDYGSWSSGISTDIPAATTDIGMQCYVDNNDSGVTKTLNMIEIHTEVPQK